MVTAAPQPTGDQSRTAADLIAAATEPLPEGLTRGERLILEYLRTLAAGAAVSDARADRLEYARDSNTVIAKGNVRITYLDTTLTADEVQVNRDSGAVAASGNITLHRGETVWTGSRISGSLRGTTLELGLRLRRLHAHRPATAGTRRRADRELPRGRPWGPRDARHPDRLGASVPGLRSPRE